MTREEVLALFDRLNVEAKKRRVEMRPLPSRRAWL
jgi:hypothetical protein